MVSDKWSRGVLILGALGLSAGLLGACTSDPGAESGRFAHGKIPVVAAENEYGNVASQVGGRYVSVISIESNPNVDPHDYEVSPNVAGEISRAKVVIQNGVGYDDFMSRLEAASPSSTRRVIDAQQLLGLPASTPNPHLWYSPRTMPRVAAALAGDLSSLQPAHAAYFRANAKKFTSSLDPWLAALAQFRARYPHTPVACTEPVADYMLQAAGADIMTPFGLQADIMEGIDPSPEDVTFEQHLFSQHRVKVLVYNQQVTDSLTTSFIADARAAGIPLVGVYETMPVPGYDYQTWMLEEVHALERAVSAKVSTAKL
jgi:zinc/manganese transport system substrate-binding protein